MVVDVALWFIVAGMIGLITLGCVLTWPEERPPGRRRDAYEGKSYHRA